MNWTWGMSENGKRTGGKNDMEKGRADEENMGRRRLGKKGRMRVMGGKNGGKEGGK